MNEEPKAGIRTTEFATTVGAIIASLVVAFAGPEAVEQADRYVDIAVVIATALAAGFYSLSRGLAKRRRG